MFVHLLIAGEVQHGGKRTDEDEKNILRTRQKMINQFVRWLQSDIFIRIVRPGPGVEPRISELPSTFPPLDSPITTLLPMSLVIKVWNIIIKGRI